QFANLAQTDHLRRRRAYCPTRADFLDYTLFKHCFYSLIDSVIKLLPVAKNEDACSRFAVRSASPTFHKTRARRLAQRGGYSPLLALCGCRFASKQTNLESAHEATPILHVDLLCRFRIEFDKLRAQFIQAHRIQFFTQLWIRRRQMRQPVGKRFDIKPASSHNDRESAA